MVAVQLLYSLTYTQTKRDAAASAALSQPQETIESAVGLWAARFQEATSGVSVRSIVLV